MTSVTFDYSASYKTGINHTLPFFQSLGLIGSAAVTGMNSPSFAATVTTQFVIGGVTRDVLLALGQSVPGADIFLAFGSPFHYPVTNYLPTSTNVAVAAPGDTEAALVFTGVFPAYPSAATVAPYIKPLYIGSTDGEANVALLGDINIWIQQVLTPWTNIVLQSATTSADLVDGGGSIAHLTFGIPFTPGMLAGNGLADVLAQRSQTVIGTDFDDKITTGSENDILTGGSGNDTLNGGVGADTMTGGPGDDTYVVDDAGDVVTENPGEGNDTIATRINNYVLPEGWNVENLTLLGIVVGTGNSGNNRITGTQGNNILAGLGGRDTLDGGLGIDTATYAASASGVNVSLIEDITGSGGDAEGDILISIERLIGSAFNDTLEGNDGDNIIIGGGGTDTISYEYAGAAVTVTLVVSTAQDTIGSGTDTLSGFTNLHGSIFDDTLTGNQLANLLIGDGGDDVLDGGAGADKLIGGLGDILGPPGTGGGGPSLAGSDTASYAKSAAAVNVSLATGKGQGGDAKGDVLIDIDNLTGSAFNDGLAGDGYDNVLRGGAGNDTLAGGAGNDTLEGGSGNNLLNGGDGVDTASYEHASSAVTVSLSISVAQNTIGGGIDQFASIESITGSAFGDTLTGSQLGNTLTGGDGNDTLNGGAGGDTLWGGSGNNTFVFGVNFGQDTIEDFKPGQDVIQLAFPQAAKFVTAAAFSDDGFGNALFVVNAGNAVTFLGVSADDLKAHIGDFHTT